MMDGKDGKKLFIVVFSLGWTRAGIAYSFSEDNKEKAWGKKGWSVYYGKKAKYCFPLAYASTML